jgi:hypothetical protein
MSAGEDELSNDFTPHYSGGEISALPNVVENDFLIRTFLIRTSICYKLFP